MDSIKLFDLLLNIVGNIGTVLTAGIALWFLCRTKNKEHSNQKRLENHLRDEKARGINRGQRSILNLVAELGISEAEILHASFKSKNVRRRRVADEETGLTKALLLEYEQGWRANE